MDGWPVRGRPRRGFRVVWVTRMIRVVGHGEFSKFREGARRQTGVNRQVRC